MDATTTAADWAGALDDPGPTQKEPNPASALAKAFDSSLSASYADFLVLAEELGVPIVRSDQPVIKAFPNLEISREDFVTVS